MTNDEKDTFIIMTINAYTHLKALSRQQELTQVDRLNAAVDDGILRMAHMLNSDLCDELKEFIQAHYLNTSKEPISNVQNRIYFLFKQEKGWK